MRLPNLITRTISTCAIAGALALGATSVQATTLTNQGWLVGGLGGSGEPYTIHWTGGTPAVNPASTGGFVGTFGSTSITYWCFDILHTFGIGSSLDYTATALVGGLADALSQLYNIASANGGITGNDINGTPRDHSAAFQLAIWDLLYDSDHSVSNTGGAFYVTGGANAINIANTWLALVGGSNYQSPTHTVIELDSTTRPVHHQNFITFDNVPHECCREVPEPPVLPLVLIALGAVALVETRRRMRVRGG